MHIITTKCFDVCLFGSIFFYVCYKFCVTCFVQHFNNALYLSAELLYIVVISENVTLFIGALPGWIDGFWAVWGLKVLYIY